VGPPHATTAPAAIDPAAGAGEAALPLSTGGMTARQAATLEATIIGLCIVAMVLVFQPFSLALYGVGAGLVVLGALIFNLVPLARRGVPGRSVVKAGLVVLIAFLVIIGLAIGSAYLYGIYLESLKG
jgi:hypothetical protein